MFTGNDFNVISRAFWCFRGYVRYLLNGSKLNWLMLVLPEPSWYSWLLVDHMIQQVTYALPNEVSTDGWCKHVFFCSQSCPLKTCLQHLVVCRSQHWNSGRHTHVCDTLITCAVSPQKRVSRGGYDESALLSSFQGPTSLPFRFWGAGS